MLPNSNLSKVEIMRMFDPIPRMLGIDGLNIRQVDHHLKKLMGYLVTLQTQPWEPKLPI